MNVIPFKEPPPPAIPHCSFCARPKSQVRTLIESGIDSKHRICGDCVVKAAERMVAA